MLREPKKPMPRHKQLKRLALLGTLGAGAGGTVYTYQERVGQFAIEHNLTPHEGVTTAAIQAIDTLLDTDLQELALMKAAIAEKPEKQVILQDRINTITHNADFLHREWLRQHDAQYRSIRNLALKGLLAAHLSGNEPDLNTLQASSISAALLYARPGADGFTTGHLLRREGVMAGFVAPPGAPLLADGEGYTVPERLVNTMRFKKAGFLEMLIIEAEKARAEARAKQPGRMR